MHTTSLEESSFIAPVRCDTAVACEVVTEFARLEGLFANWQHASDADSRAEIFQSLSWIRAFWKAYGGQLELCSPVVYEGRKVLGILPLVASERTIQFLGSPKSDYNDLLCDERNVDKVLSTALQTLLQLPSRGKTCVLDNLPEHSRIIRHIEKLPGELRRRLQLIFKCSCPTVLLRENRTEILRRLLQKESLRRHQNKLERLGKLTFRHLESRTEIRAHLERFFQQHIARRALRGQASDFLRSQPRRYCEALVEELDPSRELRFSVLELDGQPLAYHLGFQWNQKFIWYKPTFNVDYWEHSPGEVLLRKLLEWAQENAIDEFDFTTGREAFKGRFANHFRKNFTLYVDIGSEGFRAQLHQFQRRAVHGFLQKSREYLMQRPRIPRFLKAQAQQVASLRARLGYEIRHDGWLRFIRHSMRKIFRAVVWARDEVLLFSARKDLLPLDPMFPGHSCSDFKIATGTLGDLATLSLERPYFMDRAKLQKHRERLKRGDKVYIARQGRVAAHVSWMRVSREITAPEVSPECKICLSAPALVLYDCWLAPEFPAQEVCSKVLSALIREAQDRGLDVWTYCNGSNRACSEAIEKAGFRPYKRIISHRIFHWLRSSRVN